MSAELTTEQSTGDKNTALPPEKKEQPDASKPSDNKLQTEGSWINNAVHEARECFTNLIWGHNESLAEVKLVANASSICFDDVYGACTLKSSKAQDVKSLVTPNTQGDANAKAPQPDASAGTWDWAYSAVGALENKVTKLGGDAYDIVSGFINKGSSDKGTAATAEVTAQEGGYLADGRTAGGMGVHAEVDGTHRNIQLENGVRVTMDSATRSFDYHGSRLEASANNGQFSIKNGETGAEISYNGKRYEVKDRDGHVVASSENLQELTQQLRGLTAHVSEGDQTQRAQQEQQRQREDRDERPHVFIDKSTGDVTIVTPDVMIQRHLHDHYTDIVDRDGHRLRIKRGEDGHRHFYEIDGAGKETELSPERIAELRRNQGLDIDRHSKTVIVNGQQVIDGDGNLRPTTESRVDAHTGRLDAKDEHGRDASITAGDGTAQVHTADYDWQSGQGFTTTGSDGSQGTLGPNGIVMREPDGTSSSFGYDGSVSMVDPYGYDIYSTDSWGGNNSFWFGGGCSEHRAQRAADLSVVPEQYALAIVQAEAIAGAAIGSADSACKAAAAAIKSGDHRSVQSDLNSAAGTLNRALDIALAARDWDAVSRIQGAIGYLGSLMSEANNETPEHQREERRTSDDQSQPGSALV